VGKARRQTAVTDVTGGAVSKQTDFAVTTGSACQALGVKGSRLYVNSAQSISRDAVSDAFPQERRWDGSVDLSLAHSELGPDVIVGKIAMRLAIERHLLDHGSVADASNLKRTANHIMQELKTFSWHGLDCVNAARLRVFLAERRKRLSDERLHQAIEARRFRHKKD
jgi:hypothetical protein